jgi:hypothetical protein
VDNDCDGMADEGVLPAGIVLGRGPGHGVRAATGVDPSGDHLTAIVWLDESGDLRLAVADAGGVVSAPAVALAAGVTSADVCFDGYDFAVVSTADEDRDGTAEARASRVDSTDPTQLLRLPNQLNDAPAEGETSGPRGIRCAEAEWEDSDGARVPVVAVAWSETTTGADGTVLDRVVLTQLRGNLSITSFVERRDTERVLWSGEDAVAEVEVVGSGRALSLFSSVRSRDWPGTCLAEMVHQRSYTDASIPGPPISAFEQDCAWAESQLGGVTLGAHALVAYRSADPDGAGAFRWARLDGPRWEVAASGLIADASEAASISVATNGRTEPGTEPGEQIATFGTLLVRRGEPATFVRLREDGGGDERPFVTLDVFDEAVLVGLPDGDPGYAAIGFGPTDDGPALVYQPVGCM